MQSYKREPLKVGDLCIIVAGLNNASPNIGKIVEVTKFYGEHPKYGRLWTIRGRDLIGIDGKKHEVRRTLESWLMKISPPSQDDERTTNRDINDMSKV